MNTCGRPVWHPLGEPKLVNPIKVLLEVINGPPESPRQALRCSSPLTQTTLFLKIKNGNVFKHDSFEIVFSSVYCRIGGRDTSLSFVKPLPMAITSTPLFVDDEHAKGIGLTTSLNSTGSGSLIKAISLLSTQKV